MYVYMYVYIIDRHIYIYICVYLYASIYMYTHTYISIYIYIHRETYRVWLFHVFICGVDRGTPMVPGSEAAAAVLEKTKRYETVPGTSPIWLPIPSRRATSSNLSVWNVWKLFSYGQTGPDRFSKAGFQGLPPKGRLRRRHATSSPTQKRKVGLTDRGNTRPKNVWLQNLLKTLKPENQHMYRAFPTPTKCLCMYAGVTATPSD